MKWITLDPGYPGIRRAEDLGAGTAIPDFWNSFMGKTQQNQVNTARMVRIVFCSALPQEIQFLGRWLGVRIPSYGPWTIQEKTVFGQAVILAVSGMGRERMSRLLSALGDQPVDYWISLGYAGGLDPVLKAGDILEGTTVRTRRGDILAYGQGEKVLAAGSPILVCAEEVILTPQEKWELHERTGGMAVDMESAAVAAHASSRQEPFVWIRVISDAVTETVPPVLLQCVDSEGFPSVRAAIRGLVRNPFGMPVLVRHAWRSRRYGQRLAERAMRWLERFRGEGD